MTTSSPAIQPEQAQSQAAGSSFYAGMRVLPRAERDAMYAVYSFCREVDDIADDRGNTAQDRAQKMAVWRHDIEQLYAGGPPGLAAGLVGPVAQFGLRREDFLAVIEGMDVDVAGDVRWPTMAALDHYIDCVACAVGRLSVDIFGMERETGVMLAHHLGRALQLTNILRDIDEDAAIGRVYLPIEALEQAGITPTTPEALMRDPRIDAAVRPLATQAQEHFRQASMILARRPRGHLIAPRLMASAYAALLDRMIKTGWAPPRTRVRVSKPRLLLSLAWLLIRR